MSKKKTELMKIAASVLTARAIAASKPEPVPAPAPPDPNAERPIRFVAEIGDRGPQGEKGEKGDKGDKGEKGDRGERGLQGFPGVDGKDGNPGAPGKAGAKGEKGEAGEAGKPGASGDGFTWKGRWHSTQTYQKGDVVEFGGSSLIALKKTKERPDGRAVDWEMLAAHGDSGLTGAKGSDGATGPQGPAGADGSGSGSGSSGVDVYVDGVLVQALAPGIEFVGSQFATSVNSDGSVNISSKQQAGGSSAWGGITGTLSAQTDLQSALDAKAPLASPTLTGTPLAPTAAPGTNTTQISTTAFVKAAIDVVLGGVSAAFDTLAELAAGLALKLNASAVSAFGLTLVDDLDAQAARNTLGLGALATQNGPIGVDIYSSGTLVQALAPGIEFSSADFATSVNSDGSVNITSKSLRPDRSANLTAGYTATAFDAGTKTSGTFTPDPANGGLQRAINGGAHTLAPPTTGEGNALTMVIQYTNNGSAGTITTSGFTKVSGDALTTVNGSDFMMYISVINGFSHLTVAALQ